MEKKLKLSEASGIKGRITVRGYRAGAIAAVEPLARDLMQWRRKAWGARPGIVRERIMRSCDELASKIANILESYSLGIECASDNLIMTGSLTGRDLLVQYLIDGTIYATGINYGVLGTSNTAPTVSDTQLGAESVRTGPSVQNDLSNNVVQLQFYFPDVNVTNQTYYEAGSFMNGTATANSGQIFNHGLLGTPYTKTSGTDTTLEIDITFN